MQFVINKESQYEDACVFLRYLNNLEQMNSYSGGCIRPSKSPMQIKNVVKITMHGKNM